MRMDDLCSEDVDLVETATSKTDTWSKRQNRHWAIKPEEQTDTETRDLNISRDFVQWVYSMTTKIVV